MRRIIVSGIVALAVSVTACGGGGGRGGGSPADWNEKHITTVVKPKVEDQLHTANATYTVTRFQVFIRNHHEAEAIVTYSDFAEVASPNTTDTIKIERNDKGDYFWQSEGSPKVTPAGL